MMTNFYYLSFAYPRSLFLWTARVSRISFFLPFLIMMNTSQSTAQTSLELNLNHQWEFRQADSGQWAPAAVPGCVHTDLMAADLLKDPFYRLQEEEAQWVDKVDWEYRRTLTLS